MNLEQAQCLFPPVVLTGIVNKGQAIHQSYNPGRPLRPIVYSRRNVGLYASNVSPGDMNCRLQ